MAKKKKRQYDTDLSQIQDEEFRKRVEQRRKTRNVQRRRNKAITLAVVIIAFALLGTMCGRDIVRLKAENRELKKQQAALEKQRDELKEELKRTDDPEYIREQARKQLKLLNPGEILFTFDEEEEEPETEEEAGNAEEGADAGDSGDSGETGGSDG